MRVVLSHHLYIEINVNFVVFIRVGVVTDHDVIISLTEVIFFLETFGGLKNSNLRFTVIWVHNHDINDNFLVLLVQSQESED